MSRIFFHKIDRLDDSHDFILSTKGEKKQCIFRVNSFVCNNLSCLDYSCEAVKKPEKSSSTFPVLFFIFGIDLVSC